MSNQYWVIAQDGRAYGPADEATLTAWAGEGRLTALSTLQDATTNLRLSAGQVPLLARVFGMAGVGQQPQGYQQPQTYPQATSYSQAGGYPQGHFQPHPQAAVAYQQPSGYQHQQTAMPTALMPAAFGLGFPADVPVAHRPAQQAAQYSAQHLGYRTNDTTSALMYDANKKSVGVAYLLWFFAAGVGAHRFYTGNTGSAVAILVLFLVSFPLLFIFIGVFTFAIVGVWSLVDLFLIPGMVRDYNSRLASGIV